MDDIDTDALTVLTVTELIADQGSVVLFKGVTDEGETLTFAADHRCAQALVEGLSVDDDVRVAVEGWQIWSRG